MNGVAFTDRQVRFVDAGALPLPRRLAPAVRHCLPPLSLKAVMAEVDETDVMMTYPGDFLKSDRKNSRYPYCVVWTPIPILS